MRTILVIFLAAWSCSGLVSCGPNSTEKKAEPALDLVRAKSFLDSVNSKFSEHIAKGDSVALAALYWPDAELLLDNMEVVKGNDMLNAMGGIIRMGVKEMTFATTDIKGSPTMIVETGNYEMKDSSKTLLDRGKYVVIWENRNGEWKLYRDIGCTSLPPAK